MPWTLSHPAAIVPLRRLTPQPLDLAALAVGSMTPDIGYYIGRFDLAHFAHTFPGSFVACLPVGVIMLLVFYLFAKPFCFALPSPHREALLPVCPKIPTGFLRWAGILLSLLLGAWTHNFWDAFTHEHGWFVDRIPALQQSFRLGPTTVQVYFFLQELSTAAGLVIIGLAYWPWLRRQRPTAVATAPGSERWRYLFWLGLGAISFVLALPAAVNYAASTSLHGFLFYRSIVFRTAIYAPPVAVPLALLATSVIYARRSGSGRAPSRPHKESPELGKEGG